MCKNAALVPRVSFNPAKNNQKEKPPPIIPIESRDFHEAFLNLVLEAFEMYSDIARKITPIANARSAVKSSGSMEVTKNLFAMIAKPEIRAVERISSVPIISFFDTSFMGC